MAGRPKRGAGLKVDRESRSVRVRPPRGRWSECGALDPKEFDLLCCFLDHPGACLDRAALLEEIWPGKLGEVNPETVDRHVETLRRKLGSAGRRIRSVRGQGYVFE